MATFISGIGSIVTGAVSWVTTTVGSIVAEGNDILLFFVLMPFVGLGIGLLRRMLTVGKR